jgi:glycosyltransferase involved in cell wall biosynthesis
VAEILGCTRAGIVICYPEPGYLDAQPVKLFEYMSASLPVIASDFPLWREIVKGAGAGLLVDPQSTDAISDAMVWLIDNPEQAKEMGKNGKRAVEEKYNWNIESKKLIAMYRDLIKVGQSTASQVE